MCFFVVMWLIGHSLYVRTARVGKNEWEEAATVANIKARDRKRHFCFPLEEKWQRRQRDGEIMEEEEKSRRRRRGDAGWPFL